MNLLWWSAMGPGLKILWIITIAATAVFIIQSVMTFIGADTDGADAGPGGGWDLSADADISEAGSGMNLYTFRNFVNFCLGFGWTAVLYYNKIQSKFILFLIAFAVGAALVAAVMWLFKWLYGMQQSGNIDVYKSAVGCHGTVYLTIPGKRSGEGKVQISINNSIREYNAVTDSESALPTGTPVRVSGVLDESTLSVEKLEPSTK